MSNDNYTNPTSLRLGAKGMFDGRHFTVRGRVVMGMELDGETYYWNEFNLVDGSGGAVTLVHEETEEGFVWKIFRMYEPLHVMSAAEAAAKSAGDTVNFEGRPIHISLVDQSRVYHIEGEAPEGVEVGDVANYFNADAGDRTLVASWTGDEIEFYEGRDLPDGRVERAFNLPDAGAAERLAAGSSFSGSGGGGNGINPTALISIIGMVVVVILAVHSCSRRSGPAPLREPPPKQVAPALSLTDQATGSLAGRNFTIAGQALLEIARQGGKFDRREYDLVDEAGNHALLINSLTGNVRDWHLFTAVEPPAGFTPYDAAALRQGKPATIAGRSMLVTHLFLATLLNASSPPASPIWPDKSQYGLLARVNEDWTILRWSEEHFQFFTGRVLSENEVRKAFVPMVVKESP
jgi:Domain of unknown function (DUF4178)